MIDRISDKHCPDCDEAAKHAYSDSTTPGFFVAKCAKHRKTPLCGKIVKTIENTRLPCLRPKGHPGGCNPFSDTPSPTG